MQRATALIVSKGLPALCDIHVRESTTAPCRLKVGFVAELPKDAVVLATGPAADAIGEVSQLPSGAAGKIQMGDEFRLEMN